MGTDESWGLNVEEMNQLVYKDQFMFQGRFGELTFANSNFHLIYDAHTFALQNKGEGFLFFLSALFLNANYYLYFTDPTKFYISLLPSLLSLGITVRIPMMNGVNVSEIRLMKN